MNRGDAAWIVAFCAVTAAFIVPESREAILELTKEHPYALGFAKFAILATMGELLAIRLSAGSWIKPAGFLRRVAVWGLIGVLVTLMFEVFSAGVRSAIAKGLLWAGEGAFSTVATAFLISLVMNFAFAPVFMIAHRMSDTYLDAAAVREPGAARHRLADIVAKIDWRGMIGFVILKTIPFFWVPAHTITFLLPAEYRIIMAAYLSIALGIILALAKRRKAT
ncbi:MAG: hypothetical protein Q8M76_17840 [Spirochaetaceae bacterium]|nr:hypothetical protein [Spirochaetaceae bacterium]